LAAISAQALGRSSTPLCELVRGHHRRQFSSHRDDDKLINAGAVLFRQLPAIRWLRRPAQRFAGDFQVVCGLQAKPELR
jgi:hypothetical protein